MINLRRSKNAVPINIPMTARLVEELGRLPRARDVDLVFSAPSGGPWSNSRIQRSFILAKTLAGITRPFRFHDMRLEVDLQRRLDSRGCATSWPELMRDLSQVQAVDLDLDGERYRLRTDLAGSAFETFAAAGVRPPAVVTHLGPAPPPPAPPTQTNLPM